MNLIAYGSLMHPDEFASLAPRQAVPVWVRGFRRSFDQRPMWRGGGDPERTVLAVRPDPQAIFNGVLLIGIARQWTEVLDYRERGYIRTPVPLDCVQPFGEHFLPPLARPPGVPEVYVGRETLRHPTGRPLAEYHALCRYASASWGGAFAAAFEETSASQQAVQQKPFTIEPRT